MPNTEKANAVAEIAENFTSSSAAVVTEYRGLTVKQISDLRRALGRDTTYSVVKNTLTRRAAADAGVTLDDSLLVGPTAIAFVKGDPVEAAKGLRDFAKSNPLLVIKGGVMDGKALSADELSKIADLESREVLLAKLAGALKALPTRAAGLFQAPLSQMARLAKALEEKKPAEGTDEPMIGNMKRETEAAAEGKTSDDADATADPTSDPTDAPPEPANAAGAEGGAVAATDTPAEPAE